MKFRMRLGKGLKFKSRFGSRQVPMNKAVKERIVMKLSRWCEEEMNEYRDMCADGDFQYFQHLRSLRRAEQPYDPDGVPF